MQKTAEDILAESLGIAPYQNALDNLKIWSDAIKELGKSPKSYKITSGSGAGRELTRQDFPTMQENYNFWAREVKRLYYGEYSDMPKFYDVRTVDN
tara:strand:+ start:98 stop:385 length:288 start_codon:yes stop_codon:yes gene_type:complete